MFHFGLTWIKMKVSKLALIVAMCRHYEQKGKSNHTNHQHLFKSFQSKTECRK
jgi:hypothetical protein